jgi:Antitoxin VbhA
MKPTKTDDEYYELANNDVHWQVARASAQLEGFELTARDDLLAGKHVAGDITIDEWIEIITKDAQSRPAVELQPKTYFDHQTQRLLFTDEEMARQRAELRQNMVIFKEEFRKLGYTINPIPMKINF